MLTTVLRVVRQEINWRLQILLNGKTFQVFFFTISQSKTSSNMKDVFITMHYYLPPPIFSFHFHILVFEDLLITTVQHRAFLGLG